MTKKWFKAKKYGYGWTPATWQGWAITFLYVIYIVWNFFRIDSHSHSASDTLINFIPETLVATILFIYVAYKTGEKPKWRWGEDKK